MICTQRQIYLEGSAFKVRSSGSIHINRMSFSFKLAGGGDTVMNSWLIIVSCNVGVRSASVVKRHTKKQQLEKGSFIFGWFLTLALQVSKLQFPFAIFPPHHLICTNLPNFPSRPRLFSVLSNPITKIISQTRNTGKLLELFA